MRKRESIYLITIEKTQDARGVWQKSETERKVFCQTTNVNASEFYEAGRNGLNPEFRFKVHTFEYHGETLCRYKGLKYSIYRTYESRGMTELYVQREGGSN